MSEPTPLDDFMERLKESVESGSFVKLTLSKPGAGNKEIHNVYARLIDWKGKPALSFTLRYLTRDVTKNHPLAEAYGIIALWLGADFLNGDLFTTQADYTLRHNKKRKAAFFTRAPTHAQTPARTHDRVKARLVAPDAPYLQMMGIAGKDGAILASGQKKYRQINKYLEIIDALLDRESLPEAPLIVDMGSGKGYLTFALYDYLRHQKELKPRITGIELRPALVDFCNELTRRLGYEDLHFVAQDIEDFQSERIDMLIALHACDTATDLAIAKGVRADAHIIVVAPCCHRQIRSQMRCESEMGAILRHGILEERQAELLTDGMRALLLESRGYRAKVFEFIATEHTPKNLMIAAVRDAVDPEAQEKVEALKRQFGIEYHQLERLLRESRLTSE